ncbi:MAG: hypothetical protein QM813_17125 [Verrucomicrobiota bacterium]
MSKWTPRPWSVYDDHYTMQDGVEIRRLEIVALGKTVAKIYTSVPEQDTPNARLIAAAPDLYEALLEVSILANSPDGAKMAMDRALTHIAEIASAALAKAGA